MTRVEVAGAGDPATEAAGAILQVVEAPPSLGLGFRAARRRMAYRKSF